MTRPQRRARKRTHLGDAQFNRDSKDDETNAPTMLQVIGSVMAAFIGIQSKKNKERDFKHGNFKVFVVVAAIFTLLFLIGIFTVVQIVTGK